MRQGIRRELRRNRRVHRAVASRGDRNALPLHNGRSATPLHHSRRRFHPGVEVAALHGGARNPSSRPDLYLSFAARNAGSADLRTHFRTSLGAQHSEFLNHPWQFVVSLSTIEIENLIMSEAVPRSEGGKRLMNPSSQRPVRTAYWFHDRNHQRGEGDDQERAVARAAQ